MPTQFQATSKGISGAIAGETSSTSTRFLITNLISLQFTLFAICLSFSSPPLHKNLPFYSPSFSFVVFSSDLFCVQLCFSSFVIMGSSSPIACTPENKVLNFKQRGGENLKDAWYMICNAHNRSIHKQSTVVLLRSFYVGITIWYRFFLDTITGGNFLMCPSLDAFNAMGNLEGSPPIIINETVLTLEHVMQRLDAIENKMLTEEHIENLDKRIQNLANKIGSKVGDTLKILRER